MTLSNRVSAFFLAALAIALVGYSAAYFLLARNYLVGQFDDGLHNALRILVASVEVEPDDAKWQPGEFSVEFDRSLRDVRWIVSDERGQMIDHSPQVFRGDETFAQVIKFSQSEHLAGEAPVSIGDWRILQKQLNAPQPKPIAQREPHEYAGVRITVARSQSGLGATLRRLAWLALLLPIAIWLLAAAIGRSYIQHALEPLRAMADRARSMEHADFSLRLPVGPSRDELADLGNAFNGLLDELQHSYRRQHRFTGDAAHQLRTPLAVLQGQIDVALRRPRSGEEYQRTLQVLAGQVSEFRQIVDSLLFLARADDDSVAPDRERVAIHEWLNEYLDRWQDHPRRGDLALQLNANGEAVVSRPLLAQLLDNLIGNALKYSSPGTPVVITLMHQGDNLVISVSDRGIGISPADLSTIFEPFFRSDQARREGIAGTGLGLAVAARIATALRGTLSCDSMPGQGSIFSLALSSN